MTKEGKLLLWFDELEKDDVPIVGGKSASLGEMTSKTKVPVPYGFATSAHAYRYFMEKSGLNEKIKALLEELPDVEDSAQLRKVCRQIREEIMQGQMPEDLRAAIADAYAELARRAGKEKPFVAVRSSATAEDLPDASFAGQQDTYLNVCGAQEIIEKIKECYASTFTDRAVYYRESKGFEHLEVALSAVVQMMVFSKSSGVMFTVDIVTGDDRNILIEAAWGLGEYVVQGVVTPDCYVVAKNGCEIKSVEVTEKNIMMVRSEGGGVEEVKVKVENVKAQVLTDAQIKELAGYALDIEKHYGCYMDIEWGVDERSDKLWILQARPETVWSRRKKEVSVEVVRRESIMTDRSVIVKGLAASPGKAAGKARVILDPERIDEFREGEILVTEMTAPDWVPAMKKARAIVTDSGGTTCHASIVSRELGIPCIVGTKSRGIAATQMIESGVEVTVDASNGVVYDGIVEDIVKTAAVQQDGAAQIAETFPVTGTKIYMNLGDPELAEKYSALPCDGIGLMREEFIWTTYIHEHPLHLIETGRPDKVVDSLAEGMRKVCQAMSPRPVTLRFSDFKSSEYRDLKGGDRFEPYEPSALLGWRGASRYYDPKYTAAFILELKAVKKVREEYGFKNLHVMIPFCRNVDEAEKVTKMMAEQGLERSADFKVWLMAEIPANIILADKFNKYVDGYSIGSNDLTMLVLGCDRDNDTVAHIYDERNLAVKRAIRHLIEVAHKDGKTVSICGQAPSVYPEFAEFLIRSGIDSISVNPDTVKFTRKMVAQVEQRIMLDALTKRGKADEADYEW